MSMTPEDMRALSEARGRPVSASTTQTPEALDPAAVYEARGYYGDESYINELVGNTGVGSGTLEQRQNALNILIQQGKDRNLAERGSVDAFPGSSTDTGGDDDDDGGAAVLLEVRRLAFGGIRTCLELINIQKYF